MASTALEKKIRATRAAAFQEVPLARLCARVMDALAAGDDAGIQHTVAELKAAGGRFWSPTTAVQFMSGRRGQFACEAAPAPEREHLLRAHLVAKTLSDAHSRASVRSSDGAARLR